MEMVERDMQLGFGQEEDQDMSGAWEAASLGASPDSSSAPALDEFGHLEGDGDQLWATLAHQISHWEVMNRGSPLSDSAFPSLTSCLLCAFFGFEDNVLTWLIGACRFFYHMPSSHPACPFLRKRGKW